MNLSDPSAARHGLLPMRPMRGADLDAVLRIETDIYDFPWTRGNFADSLAAGYEAWLQGGPDLLQGYLIFMWSVDEVHLLNLSVAREFQGRGLGKLQLRWLIDRLTGTTAQRIVLEVRPGNQVARQLYESHGFTQIGIRKRYYPAPGNTREDALVLARMVAV